MTEEATITEQQAVPVPPRKAPIDTEARKQRAHSLPPATRYPIGAVPELFVGSADTLGNAGPVGSQMSALILATLEQAQKVIETCADGEDKIIKAENELRQNAAHTGRLVMHQGKLTAVPGQYDELARTVGPALDNAIQQIEDRIKRHATHMLSLMDEMDKALTSPQTGQDKALMAQVRDHVMLLSKPQRKTFLMKVAQDGDLVAIHTILNSPSYLMGIEPKDVDQLREIARKTVSPNQWAAYEVGLKAEKAFELAKKALVTKKGTVARYRLEDQKQATDALAAIRKL